MGDGCRFQVPYSSSRVYTIKVKVNPSNIPYVCIISKWVSFDDPWFLILEKMRSETTLGFPHIKQPQRRTVGFLQKSVGHIGRTGQTNMAMANHHVQQEIHLQKVHLHCHLSLPDFFLVADTTDLLEGNYGPWTTKTKRFDSAVP